MLPDRDECLNPFKHMGLYSDKSAIVYYPCNGSVFSKVS